MLLTTSTLTTLRLFNSQVLSGMDLKLSVNIPIRRPLLVGGSSKSMGYARRRPKLMPQKLRLAREHLHLDPAQMAEHLMSKIESHNNRRVEIKVHWVPNFELGKHEPDILTLLAYSHLVKLPIDDLVDDAVSAEAFRKRLGKASQVHGSGPTKTRKRVKR